MTPTGEGTASDGKRGAELLRQACDAGLGAACRDSDREPRPSRIGFAGHSIRPHTR
jgi:hypothetical protein